MTQLQTRQLARAIYNATDADLQVLAGLCLGALTAPHCATKDEAAMHATTTLRSFAKALLTGDDTVRGA